MLCVIKDREYFNNRPLYIRNTQGTCIIQGNVYCMAMGQAVGTAGALSANIGVHPRVLDYKLIQKRLLDVGVNLFE